jgi:hypothetical protein
MGARFALFPIARKRVLGGGRAHWEGGVRALLPTFRRFAKLQTYEKRFFLLRKNEVMKNSCCIYHKTLQLCKTAVGNWLNWKKNILIKFIFQRDIFPHSIFYSKLLKFLNSIQYIFPLSIFHFSANFSRL